VVQEGEQAGLGGMQELRILCIRRLRKVDCRFRIRGLQTSGMAEDLQGKAWQIPC
jgi:hypothetical protein